MVSTPNGSPLNWRENVAATAAKRKILVADDNDDIRAMLAELLRIHGHEVIVAEDGEQAVALAQQEQPDLILMDVMMPRLSGLEAARKIHEIAQLNAVPIVAISAFRNPLTETTNSGTFQWHAYLRKPFDPGELEQIIESLVNNSST